MRSSRPLSQRTSKTKSLASIKSCFSKISKRNLGKSSKKREKPQDFPQKTEDFQRELLGIEAAFAEKLGVLQSFEDELRSFFANSAYNDSVFLEDYEVFLQKSLAFVKTFWRNQWKIEEIQEFLSRIPRFPPNKLAIRLENMIFRTKELEISIGNSENSDKKLEIFKEVLNSESFRYLYTDSFNEIIDFYGKFKLFCKKLEIFLVLDAKISLNSFIIAEKNEVYENLFEYLLDLFEISELPIIKKSGNSQFIQLFQVLSLENLEELFEESEVFASNCWEIREIREKLRKKLQKSRTLQTALTDIFERKPKEITGKYTIGEIQGLFAENNVFLPVFERIHEKKLEKSSQTRAFLQKSLHEKSKSLEEMQKNESLLLLNYEREAVQEVFEVFFVEKLSEDVLKKLVFHYEVFKKLGLQQKHAKVFETLKDFANLFEFLLKLKEILQSNALFFKGKAANASFEESLELFSQDFFEKLFLKADFRRDLAKLHELVATFCHFRDQKIAKVLCFWRCFHWLWETEAVMSRTKGLSPEEISALHENLQAIFRDFAQSQPVEVESLLNSHYIYEKFARFYEDFEHWMQLYAEKIVKPLISEERIAEAKLEETREIVRFLKEKYKNLNLQFELAKKRVEDFEVLTQGSLICKGFYESFKGIAPGKRSYDIEKIRILHEFERSCALTRIFPYFDKIHETHNYYQNISQEIIEIKKTFNEKKLNFSKLVILQLHSKENNIIMTENVAFSREIYESYERKIRTCAQIEEMLAVLKKIRFTIKNYKDLLRQSFEMTGLLASTVQKLTREKSISGVSFDNALDFLSSLVYLRNDLVRKPLFFCKEILEFAALEWSFSAKSLLEGWIAYSPGAELLNFLVKTLRNRGKSQRCKEITGNLIENSGNPREITEENSREIEGVNLAGNSIEKSRNPREITGNSREITGNAREFAGNSREITGNSKEIPPFLVNEMSLWERVLSDGEALEEKFKEFDCFDEDLLAEMRARLGKVQEIREKVRKIKSVKAFLLENIEEFFQQSFENGVFSAQCQEFREKRRVLLGNMPQVRELLSELNETRIFLKEDTDFLLDLRKKLEEIEKSLKILKRNLRKHFENECHRTIPQDLVLNVFKSLYSSPFLLENQEIVDSLASLAAFFEEKAPLLEKNPQETVRLLEIYDKNPLFFAKFEPLLSDFKEILFLKRQVFEEMRSDYAENAEKARQLCENMGDLIEIADFDDSCLSFSWEDVEKLEEKLNKRAFFRVLEDFDALSLELLSRKCRILEEISFNKRPKAFFAVTRGFLKGILKRMGELLQRNREKCRDFLPNYKENLAFLEKFVKKIDNELAKIARNVLQDASIRGKIKESAQFFGKCVDISKEILWICSFSEAELVSFIRKIEAGVEEIEGIEENQGNSQAIEEDRKENDRKISENANKINENRQITKTFQSIFKRDLALTANKAKPKAKVRKTAEFFEEKAAEIQENPEEKREKDEESEKIREELLANFKTREEKLDFSAIERERARSVQLLIQLLAENAYISEEFNSNLACSRLETQIFKKYNEINEKYRRDMIELMDLLAALKRNPSYSAQLFSDQKKLCLEMIQEIANELLGSANAAGKNPKKNAEFLEESIGTARNLEENPQEMEEKANVFEETRDIVGILARVKDVFIRESEVFFIEDDEE